MLPSPLRRPLLLIDHLPPSPRRVPTALYERCNLSVLPEHVLTATDINCIVRMLSPLAMRALYSKAAQLQSMAQMSCRYLCELAPDYILPSMHMRLFEGLQAVTATHQTPMALQTLTLFTSFHIDLSTAPHHALSERSHSDVSPAARAALATGPRAMLEALQLALPGIDPNDLDKMASALRFYQQLCLFVPIAGPRWGQSSPTSPRKLTDFATAASAAASSPLSASLSGDREPTKAELDAIGFFSREKTIANLKAAGDDESLSAMEVQEEEATALSAWLPELANDIIRRLVRALDYFDKSSTDGGRDSRWSALYLMQWRHACSALFQQLSEELFEDNLPQVSLHVGRSKRKSAWWSV